MEKGFIAVWLVLLALTGVFAAKKMTSLGWWSLLLVGLFPIGFLFVLGDVWWQRRRKTASS